MSWCAIRMGLKMTQTEFANSYGFGVASVRSWEQRNRIPNHSTRLFLKVIEKRPDIIREVFAGEIQRKPAESKTRRARIRRAVA